MSTTTAVTVVLVDDDVVDVMAVKRAFKQHRIANPIVVARDGVEALTRLRGTADMPPLPKPYIILLDLNMPRMGGLEFLAELRADPALSSTVVFVLTTSAADEDRNASYKEHVAGYMVKSKVGADFMQMVALLDAYWTIMEFPD